MPVIKARGVVYVRLSAPDLDVMEQFLTDFGMERAARTADRLYMRGCGPSHHIHITHLGPPGFIGFGYEAASEDDLHKLAAQVPGASAVEDSGEPGGGANMGAVEVRISCGASAEAGAMRRPTPARAAAATPTPAIAPTTKPLLRAELLI